jgi:hypothetical protein
MNEHAKILINSLENESNHHILHLTKGKIKSNINDILQKIQITNDELKTYHTKLDGYRYIDNVNEYEYGRFVRWINLNKNNPVLTNGGIITSIIHDSDAPDSDVCIRVKNNRNRFFCIRSNECLIFQKLSQQEYILLDLMTYLKQ